MDVVCKPKVLFIVKRRSSDSWGEEYCSTDGKKSSGLLNSANFINEMLNDTNKVISKLVEVVDNNCIDREVTKFHPDIVVIEAIWVVAEKFEILRKLHPNVKWVIRNHSNWPFASNEGCLVERIMSYIKQPNIFVSCNKAETANSYRQLVSIANPSFSEKEINYSTPYLPNYYPLSETPPKKEWHSDKELHIGNFGAIRPLKNNLIQAIAAIVFANKIGKKLVYHINGYRIEGKAEPIMKSIVSLFDFFPEYTLVNEGWRTHDDFLQLSANMDIVMQVSFDETFDIVAADAINGGVVLVGSKEIPWISDHSVVDNITDVNSIVETLLHVTRYRWWEKIFKSNRKNLHEYVEESKKIWLKFIFEASCKNKK